VYSKLRQEHINLIRQVSSLV